MASKYRIKTIIKELEKIEYECIPDAKRNDEVVDNAPKLDAFALAKRNLTYLLRDLQQGVEDRNRTLDEFGRCQKAIELKSANGKILEQAKKEFANFQRIVDKETKKAKSKYSPDEIEKMKEYVVLFEEKVRDLEGLHYRKTMEKKNTFARDLKEQRTKGVDVLDEKFDQQFNSGMTQAFLQRKQQHESGLSEKTQTIHEGVVKVRQIAEDINQELEVQEVMLEDADRQMDIVDNKLRIGNKKLKRLVEESGGSSKMCCYAVLAIILLGLLGYLFNIF